MSFSKRFWHWLACWAHTFGREDLADRLHPMPWLKLPPHKFEPGARVYETKIASDAVCSTRIATLTVEESEAIRPLMADMKGYLKSKGKL